MLIQGKMYGWITMLFNITPDLELGCHFGSKLMEIIGDSQC